MCARAYMCVVVCACVSVVSVYVCVCARWCVFVSSASLLKLWMLGGRMMPAAGAASKDTQAARAASSASEHGSHASGSGNAAEKAYVGAAEHIEATPLESCSGGGGQSEGSGAAEHFVPADLSLDAIMSSLAGNADPEAVKIRTAARELRDARGRDRKPLLRRLAAPYHHIHVRQKLDGKWTDRKLPEIEADVKKALSNAAKDCLAFRREAGSGSDLFANPSSEESAALSWLREHLDEERAKEIEEQIRAWSVKLNSPGRRSSAKSQSIIIGRQDQKQTSASMRAVRQQLLQRIIQERGRQRIIQEKKGRNSSQSSDEVLDQASWFFLSVLPLRMFAPKRSFCVTRPVHLCIHVTHFIA